MVVAVRMLVTITVLLLGLIVTVRVMPGMWFLVPAVLIIPDTITGWRINRHLRKLMSDGR